jgi:DNA-binding response OmpR family regulator
LTQLADKTILLVDDDAEVRHAIEAVLEPLGTVILLADNGNAAVDSATENDPDLVILDMMLPKRSGFLVLENIKRDKKKGQKPLVVMITANPGQRHKAYAQSLGVDDYLNKPFRMERLLDVVSRLLGAEQTEQ